MSTVSNQSINTADGRSPVVRRPSSMDTRFAQFVIFVNSAVPLSLLGWDWYHHHLGANPTEFATRTTGALTLLFLILSLAVTPLRKSLGLPWMIKFRRLLGLYGFFYGCLHLLTYVWFDKFFGFKLIGEDIVKRPFITVGMASFVMLVPLAMTSTQKSIKRLGGKRWNSGRERLRYQRNLQQKSGDGQNHELGIS